jgi:FAD/FMN-containing dehydrogenase
MMISTDLLQAGLSAIVGTEDMISDTAFLGKYSSDQSFVPPKRPILAVRPKTTVEVREVVRMANRYNIPITPYSSGKNNQGAAIPSAGGVIVDLTKMNNIIEIDPLNRNAVIEPGVTFAQLQKEAKKSGLRVLTPLELPSTASILATYLELSPLYSWGKYGLETLLTMELILGNGETLRTGNAFNAVTKKPYDPNSNPYVILNKIWLGSQGSLAIATRGVVILKNIHEANKVYWGAFDRFEDSFAPVRSIQRNRIGEEIFMLNNTELALLLAEELGDVTELIKNLKPWNLVVLIRGFEEEVKFQEEDLKDIAAKYKIEFKEEVGDIGKSGEVLLKEIEDPSGWEKTSQFKGARNTIPFITKIEKVPEFNKLTWEIAENYGYPPDDIGCLMVPVEVGRVHYQYSFARKPNDDEESERLKQLFFELSDLLIRRGAFFSRPYGEWAQMMYLRTPSYYTMLKEFKKLLDPRNIMNPDRIFVL